MKTLTSLSLNIKTHIIKYTVCLHKTADGSSMGSETNSQTSDIFEKSKGLSQKIKVRIYNRLYIFLNCDV